MLGNRQTLARATVSVDYEAIVLDVLTKAGWKVPAEHFTSPPTPNRSGKSEIEALVVQAFSAEDWHMFDVAMRAEGFRFVDTSEFAHLVAQHPNLANLRYGITTVLGEWPDETLREAETIPTHKTVREVRDARRWANDSLAVVTRGDAPFIVKTADDL